jgi:hypothetical protein
MDWVVALIFAAQGLFGTLMLVAIVYLIFKRIKDKKNETFEKRDN